MVIKSHTAFELSSKMMRRGKKGDSYLPQSEHMSKHRGVREEKQLILFSLQAVMRYSVRPIKHRESLPPFLPPSCHPPTSSVQRKSHRSPSEMSLPGPAPGPSSTYLLINKAKQILITVAKKKGHALDVGPHYK